jgi:uncharacterized membrane protein YphA (DoxX/SURF4 family)
MNLPKIITCLTQCYDKKVNFLLNYGSDLLLLAIRISILLFAGLFTRLVSLPFIAISIIIQLLVFSYNDHFYWIFLLTTTLIYGAGRISADYFIIKFFQNDRK